MADSLFDVAGTSVGGDGTLKARFANGLETRIKMLQNAGHENIDLHRLPKQMTKAEAGRWLLKHIYTGTEHSTQAAAVNSKITSIDNKANREAKRNAVTGEKTVKPAAEKKAPATKAAAKSSKPAKKSSPAPAEAELATASA
jgi:hypothetical protein